jgi:hypothetical protein
MAIGARRDPRRTGFRNPSRVRADYKLLPGLLSPSKGAENGQSQPGTDERARVSIPLTGDAKRADRESLTAPAEGCSPSDFR